MADGKYVRAELECVAAQNSNTAPRDRVRKDPRTPLRSSDFRFYVFLYRFSGSAERFNPVRK